LRTVILPRRNQQDLDDVPDDIKQEMKFIFVDTVDEVIEAALEPPRTSKKTASTKTKPKSKTKTSAREKKRNVKSTAR
jgi:ATP-dependent Lon protease